jgi:hypothetical protein
MKEKKTKNPKERITKKEEQFRKNMKEKKTKNPKERITKKEEQFFHVPWP